MAARHSRTLTTLVRKAAELAVAAPQVVARRATRLAKSGAPLSDHDRREFRRMGAEKVSAFTESWLAMTRQALRSGLALSRSLRRASRSGSAQHAAVRIGRQAQGELLRILDRGITPVQRKATANARRLSRRSS